MRVADFDYELPPELIAQTPAASRDASRLLVLDRSRRTLVHRKFVDLPEYLRPGDLLVLNNSRVIPARLRATKLPTGSAVEVLLVEEIGTNDWWVMLRPGKRVRAGTILKFPESVEATVLEKNEEGHCRLRFTGTPEILEAADRFGEVPLPPYIAREQAPGEQDRERYQTVYAGPKGSVAAPTAGLHFTPALLESLRARGIATAEVTLHVGLGTFAPVKAETIAEHRMHSERFELGESTARKIAETKAARGRVIAVGTTSLRVLESAAALETPIKAARGRTRLFVYPPYRFKVVDALLTNFHLPQSTLLMLVSAFASPEKEDGRAWILQAYAEAVRERYRFFSYGDAMLIY
jgi:S-adenosylmethionine:tRNA ribosyltransferase-isomerase